MIRQEIWEEMKKTKTYSFSCLYYVDKKRKFNKRYNMIIIGVSAIGALGFSISHWCTFVTTIVTVALEIIKSFIPAVCQSEEELAKIDNLAIYFGETLQKIEELWNSYENTELHNESSFCKKLTKVLKDFPEKETLMNKLIYSLSKKEEKKLQDKTDNYLQKKFYEQ